MKTITIAHVNRLEQLAEELAVAFPALFAGEVCRTSIEGDGAFVRLRVPDDADEVALTAAIQAHTPRAPAPREDADGVRTGLGGIFSGAPAQRRARMVDCVEKYPPLGVALNLLRGPVTPDAKAFVFEVAGRVKAKIGTAGEVLTQAEYDALKTLTATKNLAAIVP